MEICPTSPRSSSWRSRCGVVMFTVAFMLLSAVPWGLGARAALAAEAPAAAAVTVTTAEEAVRPAPTRRAVRQPSAPWAVVATDDTAGEAPDRVSAPWRDEDPEPAQGGGGALPPPRRGPPEA